MSNEDHSTQSELELAAQPLDETDAALLAEVAALLDQVDPVPDDLVARVQFALALDEMYAEVAAITRMPMDALAVRSDPGLGERTETITFSAERLTAMVTLTRRGTGTVRVDGWIAPESVVRVVLRQQDRTWETTSDEGGRFVLDQVPEGFAQLSFHAEDTDDTTAGAVVTPVFQL